MERETFLFREGEEINTRKVKRFYFRKLKREMGNMRRLYFRKMESEICRKGVVFIFGAEERNGECETLVFPDAEERNMWNVRRLYFSKAKR